MFRGTIFGPVRKHIKHEVGRVDVQGQGVLHQIVEPGRLAARLTILAVLNHEIAILTDRGIFLDKESVLITIVDEIGRESKENI